MTSLKALQFLDLQFNCLATPGISALTGMTSLKILFLNNNRIEYLPEGFSSLSRLSNLSLEANTLSYYPGEALRVTALKSIYLKDNKVKVLPAEIFEGPPFHLTYLDGTRIEGALPAMQQEALFELWSVSEGDPTAFSHRKISSLVDMCFGTLAGTRHNPPPTTTTTTTTTTQPQHHRFDPSKLPNESLRERMKKAERTCESCGYVYYGEPWMKMPTAAHFLTYKVLLRMGTCSKNCFLARGRRPATRSNSNSIPVPQQQQQTNPPSHSPSSLFSFHLLSK